MSVRFSGAEQLHISIKTEALRSLKKLEETIGLINEDTYQWKWAIIILHNCTQIYMTLALQSKGLLNVAKKSKELKAFFDEFDQNNADGVYEWKTHERKDLLHIFDLDYFMNLYQKIKKNILSASNIILTEEHDGAMSRLNRVRNTFIHYFPVEMPLWIEHLPKDFRLVIEIIMAIIHETSTVDSFNEDEKRSIQEHIVLIEKKLKGIVYEV